MKVLSATKICTRCGVEKPREEFYAESGRCKPCAKLVAKQWREDNYERARESQRRRHRDRPDLQAARSRRYYLLNAEKMKARAARFDREHPEGRRERLRRRRARMRGVSVGRVDYAVVRLRDGDVCYLCGAVIVSHMDFDHVVPIARGGRHDYANIRVTHASCNRRKGARLPSECDWAVAA